MYIDHKNVIEAIYKEPQIFVKELRSFLEDRIIKNQANTTLKEHENQAFEEIHILLEDTGVPETLDLGPILHLLMDLRSY